MKIKATINNVNIRGCEPRENKNGDPYLIVRYEDETGSPCELVDKGVERRSFYKRDTDGTLFIEIDVGKQYTNIRIIDFKAATE